MLFKSHIWLWSNQTGHVFYGYIFYDPRRQGLYVTSRQLLYKSTLNRGSTIKFLSISNLVCSVCVLMLQFTRLMAAWVAEDVLSIRFGLVWYTCHYSDVIMDTMAAQITSLTIVYSTVYSRHRSKKTSKLHVTGLCAGNWPGTGEFHKGPVMWKIVPFDDVIMASLQSALKYLTIK